MIARGRRHGSRYALAVITVALGALFVGCGDNDADTEATGDTVEQAADEARQEAENAFASWRTDAERLLDEIQTRNAPEAKQQLLDRCRDALEQLREADSAQADRVDDLCNRIRDTEVSNMSVWREVKDEVAKLPQS